MIFGLKIFKKIGTLFRFTDEPAKRPYSCWLEFLSRAINQLNNRFEFFWNSRARPVADALAEAFEFIESVENIVDSIVGY